MPSPYSYSQLQTGPGRIHIDVVSAAAELFNSSSSSVVSRLLSILDRTLATPDSRVYTSGGGDGDATRILPSGDGPFYVGDDVSDNLSDLFTVVESATGAQIFNPRTRLYVSVTSISATVGSGFSVASLTLTFNTPVPPGLMYKVYYGKRANLAAFPTEATVNPMISRSADRVRFPEFDRTGYAPTSISNRINYTGQDGYPDPYLAHWKATLKGTVGALEKGTSGAVGYVHVGTKQNVDDPQDATLRNQAGAAFLAVIEKNIQASPLPVYGNTPYTKVNPDLLAACQNTNEIRVNAADYFRLTGPHRSSLRLGVDMLEVTFSTGYRAVYIPISFNVSDPRIVTVVTLGGENPNFGTDSDIHVKWVRPTFFAGASESTVSSFELKGAGNLVAGAITSAPANEIPQTCPFFMSGTLDPARAGSNNWNIKALAWGSFTETGSNTFGLGLKTLKGELWGDGSIQSYGGRVVGLHTQRNLDVTVSATVGVNFNPHEASHQTFSFTGTTAKVLTIVLDPNYTPQSGDTYTVYIRHVGTGLSRASTVVWPTGWVFSGTDGDVTTTVPDTVTHVIRYTGSYTAGSYFFTRADYTL